LGDFFFFLVRAIRSQVFSTRHNKDLGIYLCDEKITRITNIAYQSSWITQCRIHCPTS
jgi:hypothetical protein